MSTTSADPLVGWSESLRYRGPEIDTDGVKIDRFTIPAASIENLRNSMYGRGTAPGDYHRLVVDDVLWMSDTDAERTDHLMPVAMAHDCGGGRALVNGLGMGCVVAALADVMDHVDVVECDERIIRTVGAWYTANFPNVEIHHGDAMTYRFPKGSRWNVVWHDIWPKIGPENLPGMAMLMRRYASRAAWQDCWVRELCQAMHKAEQEADAWLDALPDTAYCNGQRAYFREEPPTVPERYQDNNLLEAEFRRGYLEAACGILFKAGSQS